MDENTNPKLVDSNIIDCIPQTEECPLKCAECYYNGGRFFRTLEKPLIPEIADSIGKIVRINSGHDSNLEKEKVIEVGSRYSKVFYNTSIPNFDFPAPVVFTCNSTHLILAEHNLKNLMYVRFRANTVNLREADEAVEYYWIKNGIPIVMTFMRYYSEENVPNMDSYEYKKHILNPYWMPTTNTIIRIMSRWQNKTVPIHGVRMCGTLYSSYCADCRNCEFLYYDFFRRNK